MYDYNLLAAWIGVALGMVSGAIVGLGFHQEAFLGGYDSWRRRLIRLGHISFFGLAAVNFAFALTVERMGLAATVVLAPAGVSLIAGAALMPVVCFLSAWRPVFRHLFALPVGALLIGVSHLLFVGVLTP